MFVCLYVYCPFTANEALDRFASNFKWGTRVNYGNG